MLLIDQTEILGKFMFGTVVLSGSEWCLANFGKWVGCIHCAKAGKFNRFQERCRVLNALYFEYTACQLNDETTHLIVINNYYSYLFIAIMLLDGYQQIRFQTQSCWILGSGRRYRVPLLPVLCLLTC